MLAGLHRDCSPAPQQEVPTLSGRQIGTLLVHMQAKLSSFHAPSALLTK